MPQWRREGRRGGGPLFRRPATVDLYGLVAKLSGGREAVAVTTIDSLADPSMWVVWAEGDERLRDFRGDDGQELFKSELLSGPRHFTTVMVAAGGLYVAGDDRVNAFGLAP